MKSQYSACKSKSSGMEMAQAIPQNWHKTLSQWEAICAAIFSQKWHPNNLYPRCSSRKNCGSVWCECVFERERERSTRSYRRWNKSGLKSTGFGLKSIWTKHFNHRSSWALERGGSSLMIQWSTEHPK